MRKSQAPSLKGNFVSSSKETNFSVTFSSAPEKYSKAQRSTEKVLDLISNSKNSSNSVFESEVHLSTSSSVLNKYSESEKVEEKILKVPDDKDINRCSGGSVTVYSVVYGKQCKRKHKTWEGDGVLEIGSKYLTLKDEEGKILGTSPCSKARKLEEGVRLYVGNKEVELLNIIQNDLNKVDKIVKNTKENLTLVKEPVIKSRTIFGKKYLPPKLSYLFGIALPEPNPQHQWHFNQNGLPLSPVHIEENLSNKLREHQRHGVAFLYECVMGFKDSSLNGAILADEMGLGKTLQCIALIWTLLKQGPYGNIPVLKKVLIVTPSSLTMNWCNEFIKWLGRIKLVPYCVNHKNKPAHFKGSVMIISYEMLVRYFEDVEKHNFDLLICDEGHRLKNSNIRTTQVLRRLACPKRILLTGTPIQNDLHEFYSLIDFVNPNVLGSFSEFRRRYMEPILASRHPNAHEEVLTKGKECSQDLKRIISKFLLRRTRDILTDYLPPRHEIVVFCTFRDVQKRLYNSLIDSFIGCKENLLGFSESFAPLELIIALRKICNHPFLLQKTNWGHMCSIFQDMSEETSLTEISTKVVIVVNFLKELTETSSKEKIVLVSYSTQTLDLLEKVLNTFGYSSCRLDGSTPTSVRSSIVDRFNVSCCDYFVFLLSAKAGGVGLNLTGASRLILFDSDWNPAIDLQAIARIWRDGQKFPVYIYRLLMTGTIEEKVYQRQISKQGLCGGTIEPENDKSIKLSNSELKDIFFSCCLEEDCLTHNILECDCTKQGEIPVPEVEPEERMCQLMKQQSSSCLKISELFHWEHHGRPFKTDFLRQLCLSSSEKEITFIFHNCKN